MENGRVAVDSVHEIHSLPLPTQPSGCFEGNFEVSAPSNETEPVSKVVLKEEEVVGDVSEDASAIVNEEGQSSDLPSSASTTQNGRVGVEAEPATADGRTAEGAAAAEAGVDAEDAEEEGYRVEERRETETVSHTEEITEKPERTELRTREIKEVTMEELKTRETTRLVSLDELKAILETEFDRTADEVEIGRDIVIEEFNRLESEHEETSGGRVTIATFSVKEERKTQEIREQLQFPGTTDREGFNEAEPERVRVEEVVETVEEVQEVKTPSSEAQAEAFDEGEAAKSEEVAQKSEEVTLKSEDVAQKSENVAQKSEEVAQKSEKVAQKSEDVPLGTEDAANSTVSDKAKVAEEQRGGEKEKGSKSRGGIINYIKVKARSLSRDRSHNRAAVLAAAAASAADEETGGTPSKETSHSNDGAKAASQSSSGKKTKQKKWKLFGKKSADQHDNSSSEASASEDDIVADKSDRKVKLIAFAKKSDEPREEDDQVNRDAEAAKIPLESAVKDDKKSTKEEGKQGRTKLGFIRKGRQKREDQNNAQDETKPTAAESEPEGAEASPVREEGAPLPQEAQEIEKTEEGGAKKPKEHKWFHFGKKTDREGHSQELEDKTDAADVKGVSENELAETVKPESQDTEEHPVGPAADDSKSPENVTASPEPKGEGQDKVVKEHKKFSFGSLFGKKNKKSEHKSGKDTDATESSKTEGETTDAKEKVVETTASELPIIVIDAEEAGTEVAATTERPSSENIEEESFSVLADEKQLAEVVQETSKEDGANADQVPELPKDEVHVDDAQRDNIEVAETEPKKQVSESIVVEEASEVGQDSKTSVDVEVDEIIVEAVQLNVVAETVPQDESTISGEEKVVNVTEHITEHAPDDLTIDEESKQLDVDQIKDETVEGKESEEVVEQVREGPVEHAAPEPVSDDAPEATAELQTAGNGGIEESQSDSVFKKEQKQTKKFSFGLKMGQKKDGGSKAEDDNTQKHKVWSPFAKKPAKKEKDGQFTAAAEADKDTQTVGDPKTPDSVEAEHAEEVAKGDLAEPKQSESREGTLKRNKGLHKLFSFGKKSKNADDKTGTGEGKAVAAETNGEPEVSASDRSVEGGGASAEKGGSDTVEEEKHRHKKFSFGLKFGKKHDKDSGAVEGSKQQQTPTEEIAVAEGTVDPIPAVPAVTEPKILEEQITLPTVQTEIETGTGEPVIQVETGEPREVTGVIVPEVYQIVVPGGSQLEPEVCQEVSTSAKIEIPSHLIELCVESELEQPGKQEEPRNLAGRIEVNEQLPIDDIEVTTETVYAAPTVQNILQDSPTQEFGGNEAFGRREDSAVVSENEEELIPKREVRLLEESSLDLEADKPTLEFQEVNRLVDDIMNSEIGADVKFSDYLLNGEISDLKVNSTEVPVVVVTESHLETTSATSEVAEVLATTKTDTEELKTEPRSIQEKPKEVTARVEPSESKPDGQNESAKEQKQKKHLFGITFGKKTKQTSSKEKLEEHEQNEAAETNGGPVVRTESDLSSEVDRIDARPQEKSKESQTVEELIIEVEVREEKEESRTDEAAERHHHAGGGIKWPHFGKKADKKKEENGEQVVVSRSDEVEPTEMDPKQTKGSAKKSSSHGLGKGFLKMFTPKKQLRFDKDHSKTNGDGDSQEPIIVYSIEGEGQVVAETHWRPKHESETSTRDAKTLEEEHPKGPSTSDDHSPAATNGKASNGEVDDKDAAPATLNGSAHELEAPVVRVSQSACAVETQPSGGVTSPGHFVVVAIDFGTTFSGYAFSFINDPDSIHMMRKWEGGDPGVVNQKTPTTILLTPDGSFHSFGFTARDFYHDLDAAEAGRWMYFEKFKMTLHHNTELNADTTIISSNGKEFPAMRLFSYALRFFKDHALKELTSQSSVTIDNDDVRWVITVPAIWKAPAKQFMRQAAYQAGIASPSSPDRLLIALEPEAASIYVRKLRMSQLVPNRATSPAAHATPRKGTPSPAPPPTDEIEDSLIALDSEHLSDHLKAGTRYMVVDCGGGTVDITVHELETDRGSLKELYKATGGPYGSTGVDQDFEKLLFAIFGSEFIETFKQKRPAGWVDLMIAFESRKRAANPHKDNPLNVSLPFSFIDFYKKQYGNQVDCAIKRFGGDRGVTWSLQGMLRLTPEAMQNLFRTTLDRITSAISDVLSNPTVKDIEYLFLVGGFSESPMLQHELRTAFDDKVRIIIPQDVSLTILKGAVCFGLDPTVVTVRQSRMTYGVGVVNRFDPARHPESKRIQKDGNDWCVGVFDTFVASGQPVTLGDKVVRRYAPASHDQKRSIIHVYCSELSDVQYVTDPGVQRCATMRLDLVDAETETGVEPGRREIEATMTFGDTEIRVSARDATTGHNVGSTIDFLNK